MITPLALFNTVIWLILPLVNSLTFVEIIWLILSRFQRSQVLFGSEDDFEDLPGKKMIQTFNYMFKQ